MNRKKKVKQTLLKQAKKARAKQAGNTSTKPKYISKARRAELEAEQAEQTATSNSEAGDLAEQ